MRYEIWTPALVFSAHDTETKLKEAKDRTARIISALASVPGWVLGNAGVPIIFGDSIAWLIRFVADVEKSKECLIEAKAEEAAVNTAISLLYSKIRGIEGRLDRLLSNISKEDRKLEVVPALQSCQEILTLFQDTKYPFSTKPEISSPLLVSFAAIYIAVCQMTVELIESYRSVVAKEMIILGNVVDDYRRRFLCFRLYQIKFPIFSRKDVIDKYDERLRKTVRDITTVSFDCFCLHKQEYCLYIVHVYGSFFDSAKVAIVDSGLLGPDETLKNEWCLEHNRCFFTSRIQEKCFCDRLDPMIELYLTSEKEVEKVFASGECLLKVSSTNAYIRHYMYTCHTCQFIENNECICRNCMLTCHKGHDVEFIRYGWFYCDCAENTNTKCKLIKDVCQSAEPNLEQNISKNKEGITVIKGRHGLEGGDTGLQASEVYYCGRKMDQCLCGGCDGFCGPISGCPCNSCRELINMAKPKVDLPTKTKAPPPPPPLPPSLPPKCPPGPNSGSPYNSCRELINMEHNTYNWPYVQCGACDKYIVGERYKCNNCNNYDLCKSCIFDPVHVSHDFIRMINTVNVLAIANVHRFVSCDGCDAHPVCGIRYQCSQCDNYDLCSSCHDDRVHWHDTFVEFWKTNCLSGTESTNWDDHNDSDWESDE